MGVYDTIIFKCPNCGEENGSQSKSGECVLKFYDYKSVPRSTAYDANRHAPFQCVCGKSWYFGNIPNFDDDRVSLSIIEEK